MRKRKSKAAKSEKKRKREMKQQSIMEFVDSRPSKRPDHTSREQEVARSSSRTEPRANMTPAEPQLSLNMPGSATQVVFALLHPFLKSYSGTKLMSKDSHLSSWLQQ